MRRLLLLSLVLVTACPVQHPVIPPAVPLEGFAKTEDEARVAIAKELDGYQAVGSTVSTTLQPRRTTKLEIAATKRRTCYVAVVKVDNYPLTHCTNKGVEGEVFNARTPGGEWQSGETGGTWGALDMFPRGASMPNGSRGFIEGHSLVQWLGCSNGPRSIVDVEYEPHGEQSCEGPVDGALTIQVYARPYSAKQEAAVQARDREAGDVMREATWCGRCQAAREVCTAGDCDRAFRSCVKSHHITTSCD